MNRFEIFCILWSAAVVSAPAHASDFARLDEALPIGLDAASIAPVFDFDSDGCLPSAGISRDGEQNGGLKPSGSLTGACRSDNFLETSNTLHRYTCEEENGSVFCAHFYSLYFEKDQILDGIESGHRHDWEYAAIWTTDGVITHGSYSAHGDLTTAAAWELPFENGHLKIVYHKEGVATHAFRFAKTDEYAENPYGSFVTPAIVSWYELYGNNLSNQEMRDLWNSFDYGSANLPVRDSSFLGEVNEFKPAGYPVFTDAYVQFVNQASGLCLDILEANMVSGTNVMVWHCNGGAWQKWHYDAGSSRIRSLQDPSYCLDNSSQFQNGANLIIWKCNGNDAQKFVLNGDDTVGMRILVEQVIDANSTYAGANVGTWSNWGGANQRWTMVP